MNESTRSDATLPRCLQCDYVLVGLSENRCPECGREFDPRESLTFRVGREFEFITRLLRHPPGRPMAIAVFLTAILTLTSVSVPGNYMGLGFLCLVLWLVLGLYWLGRLVITLWLSRPRKNPLFQVSHHSVRWLVAPLVVIVTYGTVKLNLPMPIAFKVSKPSMDDFAKKVVTQRMAENPGRIGLYPVDNVELIENGGMRFLIQGSGLINRCGFAYLPNGPPAGSSSQDYQHYSGAWWIYVEDW